MKLIANKELINGIYRLSVSIDEILPEEREQMQKFGSPQISLAPRNTIYKYQHVDALPLHDFNITFSFASESEASSYLESIKERIRTAINVLKSKRDTFSKQEEYEF